ncbi:unnamed protein product [Brachionus calyciflorus]|uniref:C-type lectin domain-containing protein n=1 Tax=Brachionus calyciflorus TaxID=104777 RepID=A0A814RLU2_9BILA|nr:unnamed protein product [Brachionus calyciflorus]
MCRLRNSIPAILDTQDRLNFASLNADSNKNYWISGYRKGNQEWRWSETNVVVDFSFCPLTFTETCLNFFNDCFQDQQLCSNLFYYICQG